MRTRTNTQKHTHRHAYTHKHTHTHITNIRSDIKVLIHTGHLSKYSEQRSHLSVFIHAGCLAGRHAHVVGMERQTAGDGEKNMEV